MAASGKLNHVIGFDDAPFARSHRGDVLIVGAVFCGLRLDGVLSGKVRRDGANATARVGELVAGSKFYPQIQAVLVQGIAFAGFNVVDLNRLYQDLRVPAIAVARRAPDWAAIRRTLLTRVPGGERKWRVIEALGPMQPATGVYLQWAGTDLAGASAVVRDFTCHGVVPEPLRVAHLVAGGVAAGQSRGRA